MRIGLLLALAVGLVACASGPPVPVEIDTRNDHCDSCRMAISDQRFAAQVVAPGEEPKRFDDVGCLRDWLGRDPQLAPGAVAFVADHRTRAWVRAADATYARGPGLSTPMASGIVAWADDASRASDPEAAGAVVVPLADVFGPAGPPSGAR